jgi:hypothetical protein
MDMDPQQESDRAKSPFYPEYPKIIDGPSLLAAVQADPNSIYLAICTVIHDRNEAQTKLKDVTENYLGSQQDLECERENWNRFLKVEKAKQVLMWKLIDRLQRGDVNAPGRPENEKGKGKQASLNTYGNENRNTQLDEALNKALSTGESYPPSVLSTSTVLSTFETRSNDSGTTESAEWRMGSLDPSAVRFFAFINHLLFPSLSRNKMS